MPSLTGRRRGEMRASPNQVRLALPPVAFSNPTSIRVTVWCTLEPPGGSCARRRDAAPMHKTTCVAIAWAVDVVSAPSDYRWSYISTCVATYGAVAFVDRCKRSGRRPHTVPCARIAPETVEAKSPLPVYPIRQRRTNRRRVSAERCRLRATRRTIFNRACPLKWAEVNDSSSPHNWLSQNKNCGDDSTRK
jgi:hypothetical protein